jgi:PAS domain S-box-containing protein
MKTVHHEDIDNLAPGDHVAILYRETADFEKVTRAILDQCTRNRWCPLYISRLPQENATIAQKGEADRTEQGVKVISPQNPDFHEKFSSAKNAQAYIRRQVKSAREAGYSAVCIIREAAPIGARRSSQKLVGDMAGLDSLFDEKSLLMICGYRMDQFPPHVLQDVMRTHPRIILDMKLIENLFYIPASDAMRYNLPSIEMQHWLDTLRKLSSTRDTLAETEDRFKDILDNANDLIQSVSPEGKFLYVNRAWRETLEYTADEASALNIFDIIDPSCMDHCQAMFSCVMSGGDAGRVEATFLSKSGKKVYVEGNVNCRIVDGKPQYTPAIFRDVTALKKEERARREREKVLDAVLNLTPDATVVTTPEGIMLYANKPARSLSPMTGREGVHGKPLWALLAPGGEEDIKQSIAMYLEGGTSASGCRVQGCDGKEWHIEWSQAGFGRQTAGYIMAIIRRIE